MSNVGPWRQVMLDEIRAPRRYALNGGPFGSKLVSSDYTETGVPVIRGVNLPSKARFSYDGLVFVSEDKADELLPNNAHPGDVLFTQRGTLGQVGLIPYNTPYSRFVISQSQMKLTVDNTQADAQFVYYYFRAPATVRTIENLALSSGVPHINLDILRKFPVLLPPLPTQRKIAAILSAYDDLIENNTRRIAILEEMAHALYHEWFVHFRYPEHEGVPLVDSEIGSIPDGWKTVRLDDALILQRGFDLPVKQRREGGIPVYAATGVVGYHDEAKVKGPGVVTGRSGSLGTVLYVDEDYWPLNTALWVREFRQVTPVYAFYLLGDLKLESFNSGAAVPTLNRNDVHGLPVVIPPASILASFDKHALPLFEMKRNLLCKNVLLRRTRDLLLPKLVSGEVDVAELNVAGADAGATNDLD